MSIKTEVWLMIPAIILCGSILILNSGLLDLIGHSVEILISNLK